MQCNADDDDSETLYADSDRMDVCRLLRSVERTDYATDDDEERYHAADEQRRNIASAGRVQIRLKLEVSTASMPPAMATI